MYSLYPLLYFEHECGGCVSCAKLFVVCIMSCINALVSNGICLDCFFFKIMNAALVVGL